MINNHEEMKDIDDDGDNIQEVDDIPDNTGNNKNQIKENLVKSNSKSNNDSDTSDNKTNSSSSKLSDLGEEENTKQKGVAKIDKPQIHNETKRSITIGSKKRAYGNNFIKTNKYSLLTFVPVNLFEQFTKVANMYFLFIAILQCIPDASITKGMPLILIPLSFIVLITAIKDIIEDLKRYNSDKEENRNKTEILAKDKPKRVLWENIFPGDILIIKNGEKIPADCLLVFSSKTELNRCYVETKSLDGETNLKKKQVVSDGTTFDNVNDCLEHFKGREILYERENPNLNEFEGKLDGPCGMISLSFNHLLLRGSSLQNTDYVYAVVLFTG